MSRATASSADVALQRSQDRLTAYLEYHSAEQSIPLFPDDTNIDAILAFRDSQIKEG